MMASDEVDKGFAQESPAAERGAHQKSVTPGPADEGSHRVEQRPGGLGFVPSRVPQKAGCAGEGASLPALGRDEAETDFIAGLEQETERLAACMENETDRELVNELKEQASRLEASNRELARRIDQLSALHEVSAKLQKTASLSELLSEVARGVETSLGFGRVLINLVNAGRGVLERRAAAGVEPSEFERLKANPPPLEWITNLLRERYRISRSYLCRYTERRALLHKYGSSVGDTSRPVRDDEWHPLDILLTPIFSETKGLVGTISVDCPEGGKMPSRDTIRTLEIFASTAAMAIERVRLQEQVVGHSQELEVRVADRTKALMEAQGRALECERLAAIGRLAASVGHEIRNPLGVIRNSCFYLCNRLDCGDEKVAKHLDIIEREVNACNKIVGDLLDFSRKKALDLSEVDVKEVMEEVVSESWIQRNTDVSVKVRKGTPRVLADPDRLRQVFLNCISNAVQAMPDGGRLDIHVGYRDAVVEISFSDSGCGIAEKNLTKIFAPLFTTRAHGIGLGLAVSRSIVEQHGGTIGVVSEEGEGSTFTITLPLRPPDGDGQ